jgi:hypothetical protein
MKNTKKLILTASALAIFLISVPNAYARPCPCNKTAPQYEEVTTEKTSNFSWNIFKGFKSCSPCVKQKVSCKKIKQAKNKCNKCTGAAAPVAPKSDTCEKTY